MEPVTENQVAVPEGEVRPPSPQEAASVDRERIGLLSNVQSLASTFAIALFIVTFIVQAFQIPSESMENTLLIGDYLLVDKVEFAPNSVWQPFLPYEKIKRGDIVVFKWPVHPEQHFVKRVIGVPGDRVRLINNRVFVNGTPIPENYTLFKARGQDPFRDNFPSPRYLISPQVTSEWWKEFQSLTRNNELVIPEENYFVLGDNRNESLDSRYWGFVPRGNIVGRPLMIYFSVRQSKDDAEVTPANGKIESFTARLWQWPDMVRWKRAFRIVK